MIASEAVKERVQIPLATESLSEERIAYLEGLVSQARTAAAVFTQFTQEDVDRIVKADGPGRDWNKPNISPAWPLRKPGSA